MTIQQQCAERVYKILPELKELKFGCEVRHRQKVFQVQYIWRASSSNSWGRGTEASVDLFSPYESAGFNSEERVSISDVEIIGQKIGICEVLRAINKRLVQKEDNFNDILINSYGIIGTMYDIDSPKFYQQWKLLDDNILSQSDECALFILSVLK